MRDVAELVADGADDRVRVGVRVVVDRGQHRDAGRVTRREAPRSRCSSSDGRRHAAQYATFLESIQKRLPGPAEHGGPPESNAYGVVVDSVNVSVLL